MRAPDARHTLLLLALLTSVSLLGAQPPAALDLNQIVSRMEQARLFPRQTAPFQLTREYRLFHEKDSHPTSEVKAEINVIPPHEHDYRIVESKGSGRGEKVVRKILDHETAAEKASPPPTAVVHENYEFAYAGEETFQGARCYVLSLRPKREETSLVEGRAWVDADTFLVRKIEGELSKSPSWWVKHVRVTVVFDEIGGVWTQASTLAVAEVRFVGQYTVTGHVTSVHSSDALAANNPGTRASRRRTLPAEVLTPGVLVPQWK